MSTGGLAFGLSSVLHAFSLDHLLSVARSLGPWVYVLLGGLAFAEAAIMIGVVFPGETALLVGGVLANQHVLSLPAMIVVAVVCAVAGDSVGYEVGRVLGPRLRSSRLGRRVGDERWERGSAFLERHGGKSVFLARGVALLRALVPGIAGMSRMRYRTFLPWNAAGGLVWGTGCVLLGYAFAQSIHTVASYTSWGGFALFVLVVGGFLGWHLWRRRHEGADDADDRPEPSNV